MGSITEFFSNLVTMAEAGNWNGILALFGTLFVAIASFVGVGGLITLIYKIFSNRKLL